MKKWERQKWSEKRRARKSSWEMKMSQERKRRKRFFSFKQQSFPFYSFLSFLANKLYFFLTFQIFPLLPFFILITDSSLSNNPFFGPFSFGNGSLGTTKRERGREEILRKKGMKRGRNKQGWKMMITDMISLMKMSASKFIACSIPPLILNMNDVHYLLFFLSSSSSFSFLLFSLLPSSLS